MRWLRRRRGGEQASEAIRSRVREVVSEFLARKLDSVLSGLIPYYKGLFLEAARNGSLESLAEKLSIIKRDVKIPGQVYYATTALEMLSRGDIVDSPREGDEALLDVVTAIDETGKSEASQTVLEEVKDTNRIVLIGYSEVMERVIDRVSPLSIEVTVLEGGPAKSGRLLARYARRKGVKTVYVPDTSIYWVLRDADALVIPAYGVVGSSIVSEAGSAISASVASEIGVSVLAVGSEYAITPPGGSVEDILKFHISVDDATTFHILALVSPEKISVLAAGKIRLMLGPKSGSDVKDVIVRACKNIEISLVEEMRVAARSIGRM